MPSKALKTEKMVLNLGPQHPSTHGVLHLIVTLDGEYVADCESDIGFLHRSNEKLCEARTYYTYIPLTDRADYLASMFNNYIFCKCAEALWTQIEPPVRAQYIRMIAMELNRIASHLLFWGTFGLDSGALTPILWAFREREMALDLLEMACGARINFTYIRLGGVREDLPEGFMPKLKAFLDHLGPRLDEYESLLSGNEIFQIRTKGVGLLSKQTALDYGVSGPMLRASGVAWDIRKAEPYLQYDKIDFEVPCAASGDTFDRYHLRVLEMRQCIRILRQCMERIPPVAESDYKCALKISIKPKVPKGEVYERIESPRGELGGYLVSDGTPAPYRFKMRTPSFANLQALPEMAIGKKVADLIVILGSIDIVLGDVDR